MKEIIDIFVNYAEPDVLEIEIEQGERPDVVLAALFTIITEHSDTEYRTPEKLHELSSKGIGRIIDLLVDQFKEEEEIIKTTLYHGMKLKIEEYEKPRWKWPVVNYPSGYGGGAGGMDLREFSALKTVWLYGR